MNDKYTLYHGDCLEYMRGMADNSVDAVITDPPYGVMYSYNEFIDTKEYLESLVSIFIPQSKRIAKRIAIFTGIKNIGLYRDADWFYSWVVPAGSGSSAFGFTCWTPIAFYGKDIYLSSGRGRYPDIFVDKNPKRTGEDHPCEKPLSVMKWALERFSNPDDTILDPFMGSGTTGVACAQTGRRFIGCEIDAEYFKIAERRIRDAYAQPLLFDAPPKQQATTEAML